MRSAEGRWKAGTCSTRSCRAGRCCPLVGLATCATVIASQALITGAFSLTRQAIAFGLFPRLQIVHTSGTHEGQIYVPVVNRALLVSCVFLVVGFGSSSRLAAAYGFAVSGVMLVTSIAMAVIATRVWGWRWYVAAPLFGFFAAIEAVFFASSSLKILHGAWLPLVDRHPRLRRHDDVAVGKAARGRESTRSSLPSARRFDGSSNSSATPPSRSFLAPSW